MVIHNLVKQNAYFDSVTLMLFSSKITGLPGIKEAAVMMGTDHNKALMKNSGILSDEVAATVTGNDLVIGILAESQEVIDQAMEILNEQFHSKTQEAVGTELRAKTVAGAVKKLPDLNMAVISVPGRFAKSEAMKCMENGVHVLMFSDNVSVEEENELKEYAVAHNLLMMGPDCGTAIVNGVALGFANVVRKGNIGLAAASGTGLQEVSVIIDKLGGGISQALGTGGRDLKAAIGGKMMLLALDALDKDPETEVIGIVSKPPAKEVMQKILDKVKTIKKPVVTCFLGGDVSLVDGTGAYGVETLEDAAAYMVNLAKGNAVEKTGFTVPMEEIEAIVREEKSKFTAEQKYLRGLFSGGTLGYESILILQKAAGGIYSNIALDKEYALEDVQVSKENTILDMGDDYFTDGIPHPMIDPRQRIERIKKEAKDPQTAVILLDCVLGFGCHEDPAGALVQAITDAKAMACGRHISFVASVCGTEQDIQKRSQQAEKLKEAGVIVMPTNAQAARIAMKLLENR